MERKTFTTSIEPDTQLQFKKKCKENNERMNDVLEALMQAYISEEITFEREVIYKIKKNKQ